MPCFGTWGLLVLNTRPLGVLAMVAVAVKFNVVLRSLLYGAKLYRAMNGCRMF